MTLDDRQLQLVDAHWRPANYLSVGQTLVIAAREDLQIAAEVRALLRPDDT